MLIPYNTDAPLYHFPATTIGLIAANGIAFVVTMQADPDKVVPWLLQFGVGIHPLQWISGNFLHADILHILGNMFYLWGFGLVVEGKLGWWRFLLLYLAIGAISSAIEQVAMLNSQGAALGASGVICGLMAISLIWAPKNEMSCFLWIFIRPIMLELPITVFATTFLVWQGIVAWLTHFAMSSAMLHLIGAGIGAVFGVILLKFEYVDCEGWDLFAWWHDNLGSRHARTAHENKPAPPSMPSQETLDEPLTQFLTTALRNRLRSGDVAGALEFYEKQRATRPGWKLNAVDLMALILALHKQNLCSQSVAPLVDYLRRFPDPNARLRLKLAEILLDFKLGPAKALRVLAKVPTAQLMPELQVKHGQLLARAEQQQTDADFELVDDDDL